MVAIEYIDGQNTFTINNISLVRNFHAYVSGTKLRIVNAYDTRNEILRYTDFSDISLNGQTYNSVAELVGNLAPVLFLKKGGSGTGNVPVLSGNIITKTVPVQIDWAQNPDQQVVDFVNGQEFSVSSTQRILFKAVRITGDLNNQNSAETYFWEFKPGKGTYGINGIDITLDDIEFISYVTNYQNNVIDLGEINATPIEVFINDSGPYLINTSVLNVFKATRQGNAVNYIYVGTSKNIGDGEAQTVSDDFLDVNATPVENPNVPNHNHDNRYYRKEEIDNLEDVINANTNSIDSNEIRIGEIEGLGLFANQVTQEIYIRNASGTTLSTLSVAFLNNEGTTFFYNATTEKIELKNDQGEVLSEVPVSAFVSNLAATISLSGNRLSLRDNQNNEISFVNFEISNINGLQAALDGKQDRLTAYKYFHQLTSVHNVKNIINNAGGSSSTYKTGGYFYISMNASASHPSGMPSEFVYDSGNNNHVAILYLAGTGQPGKTAAHITDFAGNVYTIFGENTNGDSDWKKNNASGGGVSNTDVISYALSSPTDDLVTGDTDSFHAPYDFLLNSFWIGTKEVPGGSDLVVDLKKNGTSVTSTNAAINSGELTSLTGASPVITTQSFIKGDLITPSITQVGAIATGKSLKIYLEITKQ